MSSNDRTIFEKRQDPEGSRPGDKRKEFSRDWARVIHSAGFRRLQGKTQVMGAGEGDFHQTRLTHSVECAQIGYGLPEHLPRKERSGGVDHDIEHPPFEHGGGRALHAKMRDHGGFEGNSQTLRILTRLKKQRQRGKGLKLPRLGVTLILPVDQL